MPDRCGLLVDFGGVLTTDVFASFQAFCEAEGLAPRRVRDVFAQDAGGRRLLADRETGRVGEQEFERGLATVRGLAEERAPGLVDRLFAGMRPDAGDGARGGGGEAPRRADGPAVELVGQARLRA